MQTNCTLKTVLEHSFSLPNFWTHCSGCCQLNLTSPLTSSSAHCPELPFAVNLLLVSDPNRAIRHAVNGEEYPSLAHLFRAILCCIGRRDAVGCGSNRSPGSLPVLPLRHTVPHIPTAAKDTHNSSPAYCKRATSICYLVRHGAEALD